MLDDLKPAARHFVLLVVLAFATALLLAVGADMAQLGLDAFTRDNALDALDTSVKAAGAGLGTWVALVLTPLTRQYGVGSSEGDK